MNATEYNDWLNSLKEGDEVCYYSRWHGYTIDRITKITPSRWIKIKGMTFKNGVYSPGRWENRLQPITEEIRQKIWRRSAEFTVSTIQSADLTNEQLKAILNIFKQKAIESTEQPQPKESVE